MFYKTQENLTDLINKIKGKKVVFTNGCFDILHIGHIRYLQQAKKLGDVLIVGLNTDDSVKNIKDDNRPIVPENERAEILDELQSVDFVVLFQEETPLSLIKKIKPDIYVKGGDYNIDEIPEPKLVQSLGGKIVILPLIKNKSTTKIIQKILKNYYKI